MHRITSTSLSAQTDSSHSAGGLPSHTRFRASHSSPDLQTGVQNHFVFEEALHRCNFKTGETNTVEQRSLLRVNKSCFHHYIHTHRVVSTGLLLTRFNLRHYCQLCKPPAPHRIPFATSLSALPRLATSLWPPPTQGPHLNPQLSLHQRGPPL